MACAGHEYPLVWRADGMELPSPYGISQPLGLFAEPALDVQTHALLPGDTRLLYTDGVTDTTNPAGAFFAQERLYNAIRTAPATTAQGLCDPHHRDGGSHSEDRVPS
jgi:phosphoserine phosphatase RsbU/P